jgi:aspartate 1-decarboxylase
VVPAQTCNVLATGSNQDNLERQIMKKAFLVLPLVAALAACSTTQDKFDKRADNERERQEKQAERAVSQAPKWMESLPTSENAVYANGTAVSRDMGMASNKAKTIAYGKICMAAGGQVDQQSKVYMMDNESAGSEMSDTAIRSMCKTVDITGVETVNVKTIAEGTRFRSYVLVSLPTGDANRLQVRKDGIAARKVGDRRANEAFNELDANSKKPAE